MLRGTIPYAFNALRLAPLVVLAYAILTASRWYRSFTPATACEIRSQYDLSHMQRMTWRSPFVYEMAVYASTYRSFYDDQSHFFDKAQLLATVKNNNLDHPMRRFRAKATIDKRLLAQNTTVYLHLFMQRAHQMNPHPKMTDPFLVHSLAPIIIVENDADVAPLTLKNIFGFQIKSTSSAPNHGAGLAGKQAPLVTRRVAWEAVLENHSFCMWKMPIDVSRLANTKYYSPDERRAYNPIVQRNPLVAAIYGSREDYAAHGPFAVDISIDQVSLEWIRLVNSLATQPSEQRPPQRQDHPFGRFNKDTGLAAELPYGPLLSVLRQIIVSMVNLRSSTRSVLYALLGARLVADLWIKATGLCNALFRHRAAASHASPLGLALALAQALCGALLFPYTGIGLLDKALKTMRWMHVVLAAVPAIAYMVLPVEQHLHTTRPRKVASTAMALLALAVFWSNSESSYKSYVMHALLCAAASLQASMPRVSLGGGVCVSSRLVQQLVWISDGVLLYAFLGLSDDSTIFRDHITAHAMAYVMADGKLVPQSVFAHSAGPAAPLVTWLNDTLFQYWPLVPAFALMFAPCCESSTGDAIGRKDSSSSNSNSNSSDSSSSGMPSSSVAERKEQKSD
ncbi:hypothetical protein GGI07_001369 [Coemansia sp. Benny D115]|nr:hypothetical protein GGI07_001369 [Coemansia sp. Benny D115]